MNKETFQNQTLQQESNQRDKYLGCSETTEREGLDSGRRENCNVSILSPPTFKKGVVYALDFSWCFKIIY